MLVADDDSDDSSGGPDDGAGVCKRGASSRPPVTERAPPLLFCARSLAATDSGMPENRQAAFGNADSDKY